MSKPPAPGGVAPRVPVAPPPVLSTSRARSIFAFQGPTLDGGTFDFDAVNASRRIVVYLFDPSSAEAAAATRAAVRLHEERHRHDLVVVGVAAPPGYKPLAGPAPRARASEAEMAAAAADCLKKAGAAFPCLVDPTGAISDRYTRAAGRVSLVGLPAFFVFPLLAQGTAGNAFFAAAARESTEPADYLYRGVLRLFGIEPTVDVEPLAGDHPKAPDITFVDTQGTTRRLSDYRGQLVVLTFIGRECPQCKVQLEFLEGMLKAYGRAARPGKPALEVLAVCLDASGSLLRSLVAERGYTFPVGPDPDWSARGAYRFHGPTPETFVIAPDRTVSYHHRDHVGRLDGVLHMEIRTLLGLDTKPLLAGARYSGDRACRVCHTKQYADWKLTRHACAWDTLVRLSRQDDRECVECHVVASTDLGGFISEKSSPHLTSVQCESCHGGNGCSAFTGRPAEPVKPAACEKCHDAKHSPRFDFGVARLRVLHTRADELAKLPRAEREAQLEKLCMGTDRQLFDPETPYIGSAACAKCHPTEDKAVQDRPHALAMRPLATPAPDTWRVPPHKRGVTGIRKPECLRCHVTGYGKPGGFPAAVPHGEEPLTHPMAGVGCEACHGPGKAHAADPKAPRAIARLGGTCNECNILPICRQCHDGDNSPGFDYRSALLRVRHMVGKAVAP